MTEVVQLLLSAAIAFVPVLFLLALAAAVVLLALRANRRARDRALNEIVKPHFLAQGYTIVRIEPRHLRVGPFFFRTSRAHVVFRVELLDRSGSARVAWARWGRWLPFQEQSLTVRWE